MRCSGERRSHWISMTFVIVASVCFLMPSVRATAQQGQNAVYSSSGTKTPLPDFIDASQFGSSTTNICTVLNFILNTTNGILTASGGVIDARGLPGTTSTSMTCTASPWTGITSPPPSTILLPAGTIVIPSTWILPSNTHLIGEGDGIPVPSVSTPGTTIQFASISGTATMIQFGSSSPCSGISVERLTLDAQDQALNGIANQYCQASYVDHVSLYQILGTGLSVSGSATDSGPYSNIAFDTGGYSGTSSTVCVSINNAGHTRGIHGLYCKSETNDAPAAVLLDSSNNSIEDVTVVGFYDGILVGANANAQSNVLVNITGDTTYHVCSPGCVTPVRAIHIANNSHTVTDLSIMGVSNSGLSGTYTIVDDVTGTDLLDSSVAIYALGQYGSGGYSRFTTSPNAATWASGTGTPSSCTASAGGSLFSNTSGSGYALYVCPAGGGSWKGIL